MTSPTNTTYFDDAQSVRQPIPVTSAKSRRLSREASDSASNRPTLVRVNAPTVQRAQVRATGRKGVAMQASDSRLERRYTFYGHHTPPHLLQPRHRTSLTLQVGREFERLLPPRFDLDLDRDCRRRDFFDALDLNQCKHKRDAMQNSMSWSRALMDSDATTQVS